MDNHTEFSDLKRIRHDNPVPEAFPSSPEQNTPTIKKRKRRKRNKASPNPLTIQNPNLEHPQLCLQVIEQGQSNAQVKGALFQVCPKHEPLTPRDVQNKSGVQQSDDVIVELANQKGLVGVGPNEAIAQKPDLTPLKETPQKNMSEKRKTNVVSCQEEPTGERGALFSTVELPIPVDLEPNIVMEKGAEVEPNEANKHDSAILVVVENNEGAKLNEVGSKDGTMLPVELEKKISVPSSSTDTPWQRKWEGKKKNEVKPQGAEHTQPKEAESNAENPQVCPKPEVAPPVDTASSIDSENIKKEVATEVNAANPQVCYIPESAPAVGLSIPTKPIEQSRRKARNRRGRKRKMCLEEKLENQSNLLHSTLNQTPPDPTIPLCPKPASPMDQTIPVSPAIQMDVEQKTIKKKRKKKRKTTLNVAEPIKHNTEQPETPIQTSICPIPAAPVSPTISADPEQKTTKKKRKKKKKRKSALKSEGEEPNKHDGKPPETPVQRSMCSMAALPTDQTTPVDPELKITKKTRKKKRNNALKCEGTDPNKHDAVAPVETSVPRTTKGLTITAVPLNWPNESSMRKCNAKPLAKTRVKRTLGHTAPGVPSEWHDKSFMICRSCQQFGHRSQDCPSVQFVPVEDEVYRDMLSVEGIALRCRSCQQLGHGYRDCPNVQCVSLDDEVDIDIFSMDETALRCWSCQQLGHRSRDCRNVQPVSLKDEICFFCGELGHSLGECSVSTAGGGRFAKCLFCFAQGHFSKYCPEKCFGFYP